MRLQLTDVAILCEVPTNVKGVAPVQMIVTQKGTWAGGEERAQKVSTYTSPLADPAAEGWGSCGGSLVVSWAGDFLLSLVELQSLLQ